MSTVAASGLNRRTSPWIESAPADLLLYVWTPLLIVPLVFLATNRTSPATVGLWVASFGALGHHLPGMMRAYGDRALFQRFRTRFIVAPLFLIAVCAAASVLNRSALLLVVFSWGTWHGLMQSHGMARIYDAKVGSTDRLTARLDHLLIFSWFGAGVFLSQTRWSYMLEAFYGAGGPIVPGGLVPAVQLGWGLFTAAVTVAFLVHLVRGWSRGQRQSPVKLLLHVTTIAYWIGLTVFVPNLIVSIVLFEIFHDVQYLSIVWRFNRARVEKDPEVGTFSRFLFRPSWGMLGLYVGLVFAYGSMNLAHHTWLHETVVATVLTGVLTASALLHFYYDGFIWKMRERGTRETLGLASGDDAGGRAARLSPATVHGLKWAIFVVPLVVLGLGRLATPAPQLDTMRSIAEVAPDLKVAQYNFGVALQEAGDLHAARETLQRARTLAPQRDEVDHGVEVSLAWVLVDLALRDLGEGRTDEARPWLREAVAVDPAMADAVALQASEETAEGDLRAAELHGRAALIMEPEHRGAHYVLAHVFRQTGRPQEALRHAREFARLAPRDARALSLLAALGG